MLDHVITEIVSTLRDSLEDAMLEQAELDDRFRIDMWLGDIDYGASYTLPGEPAPPRIRSDISLLWTTFSQSSYRSWWLGRPT